MEDYQPTMVEQLSNTTYVSLLKPIFGDPYYSTYEDVEKELQLLTQQIINYNQ